MTSQSDRWSTENVPLKKEKWKMIHLPKWIIRMKLFIDGIDYYKPKWPVANLVHWNDFYGWVRIASLVVEKRFRPTKNYYPIVVTTILSPFH